MRRVVLTLILLLLSTPSWAGIAAPIQTKSNLSQSGDATIVWTGNPVTGNAVLACAFWLGSVTVNGVSDTQGNTYADSGAGRIARPTDGFIQCFGATSITGGTTPTITWDFSSAPTAGTVDLYILEYQGVHSGTMFGGTATGTATSGTTVTSGTLTPGTTDGAIVAFSVCNVGTTGLVGALLGTTGTSRLAPASWSSMVQDRLFTSDIGTGTVAAGCGSAATKSVILGMTLISAPAAITSSGGAPPALFGGR